VPLAPGSMLGRYRIIGPLGAGGMAAVYRAWHPGLEADVAIKVINPSLAPDPEFQARFRREAAVLHRLNHPNLLRLMDIDEIDGQLFIVYPYVAGGTLADLLRPDPNKEGARIPLPPRQVVQLLRPVAAALDYAHEQGVLHRDIKPANVLLTPPDEHGERTPIVADFGVARLLENTQVTSTQLTLGTAAYMAPEQWRSQPLTAQTDEYALAVTAYQMLTGTLPFSGGVDTLGYQHVHEPVPPPTARNPKLNAAVGAVLARAMAKLPGDRYPTCSEFVAGLAEAVDAPLPATEVARVLPATEAVPAGSNPEPVEATIPATIVERTPVSPAPEPVAAAAALATPTPAAAEPLGPNPVAAAPAPAAPASAVPPHIPTPPPAAPPRAAVSAPRRRGLLYAGLAALVVVLIGGGVAALLVSRGGGSTAGTTASGNGGGQNAASGQAGSGNTQAQSTVLDQLAASPFNAQERGNRYAGATPQRLATSSLNNAAQQNHVVGAVRYTVKVAGATDTDWVTYLVFPSAGDAQAYFATRPNSGRLRPTGFQADVRCWEGHDNAGYGFTSCDTISGWTVIEAESQVAGANSTLGNDQDAQALLRLGWSHLQGVQQ